MFNYVLEATLNFFRIFLWFLLFLVNFSLKYAIFVLINIINYL